MSASDVPPSCILRRAAALTALITDDRMPLVDKKEHKVNKKELQFEIEGKLSRKNIKKKNASNQIKSDLPTLVPIGPLRQL